MTFSLSNKFLEQYRALTVSSDTSENLFSALNISVPYAVWKFESKALAHIRYDYDLAVIFFSAIRNSVFTVTENMEITARKCLFVSS